MSVTKIEIRPGAYYDSVVLMHLQRALTDLEGVEDAGVVMATPANCELLADGDLYPEMAESAKSDDLLIVVKAENETSAAGALAQVDALISARRSTSSSTGFRPRSLESAVKNLPSARWLLVSVPGRYAADLTRKGLSENLNVFLYSDNVSLEDEIALKKEASKKGLLVMGPDCGTAIINGVGLGFANRVRKGSIGLVGASGTGLQAVTSAIHELGGGISHAIGTGGRDLKKEVGGATAIQGLEALAADDQTDVIVLVSKPPSPDVAAKLLSTAQTCGKPVVVNFIGYPAPAARLGNVYFAVNLHEAARISVDQTGSQPLLSAFNRESPGYLRGLFSGGTLAVEAVLALQNILFPLYSNVPISQNQIMANPMQSEQHTIVDLGEDVFTQGRLHPMMDNDLRIRRMRQEADDPDTGTIWLDVVLGEGAHSNPASELAPVIQEIRAKTRIECIVLIIGTSDDPQDIDAQAEAFRAAGAVVFFNLQETVEHIAARHILQTAPSKQRGLIEDLNLPFSAVNAGLESFYDSLIGQGASAIHMEWRPPAGGNEKLAGILAKLKG